MSLARDFQRLQPDLGALLSGPFKIDGLAVRPVPAHTLALCCVKLRLALGHPYTVDQISLSLSLMKRVPEGR